MTTRCLFRAVKHGLHKGSVDAVLFDNAANRGMFVYYTHVGQHSEGRWHYYLDATRPTTPEEYADLKAELEQIYGEPITVYRRLPKNFQAWSQG
jgi:hypothetical protein